MNKYRKPAVAGLFYKADPKKLTDEINILLSVSKPEVIPENIFGIISPHAGYIYSGRTAAFAFNLLKNKNYETVIIISPSHREYFPGISIFDGAGYETPLGKVEIDIELSEKLISDSKIIFKGNEGHKNEHAVEVQIPFLQTVLKDFKIVPVVMGDQSKNFIDELSFKISQNYKNDILIVASSDLSHYYTKEQANYFDSILEKNIMDFNFEELQSNLENKICEACGGGTIVALMKAANLLNKKKSLILNRSDSSATSGNTNEVVGYLSAAIF